MSRFNRRWKVLSVVLGLCVLAVGVVASAAVAGGKDDRIDFNMVRSQAAVGANCLPDAGADVRVRSKGATETMTVDVEGLPPNTDFDFFVIQVPNAPVRPGLVPGRHRDQLPRQGSGRFIGRFSIETFIVAPGSAPAPVVHDGPFPDASTNPPTAPVHTYHLGLWFNSPDDAVKAGCPGNVTPFNGDHNAGIQVLSTNNAPDNFGPLRALTP